MTSPKARGWIGAASALAVVIMLLAWFLAISPTLTAASDTRAQAGESAQNDLMRVKIDGLKKQAATLDDIKAELAAQRLQIPTSHDEAEFQRQIVPIAAAHSVTIVSGVVSPAAQVVPLGSAAPAPTATETAAATDATDADMSTPAGPVGEVGFYSMATSLDVVGSYQDVLAFVQDLQAGIQRLFLLEGLSMTGQPDTEAAGGKPALVRGDLAVTITGSVYVLTDTAAAAAPAAPAVPPTLPVPDPAKNPFLPFG